MFHGLLKGHHGILWRQLWKKGISSLVPPNISLMADIELGDGRALEADWLLELSLQRG